MLVIPNQSNLYHAWNLTDISTGEIVYRGVDFLRDIVLLSEPKKAKSFNHSATYKITILGIFEKHYEAYNMSLSQGPRIPRFNEEINLMNFYKQGAFVCIQTGQRFHRQSEACKALGISQSNLSKHLQGHPYYKHVRGYTFKYLSEMNIQAQSVSDQMPQELNNS